MLEDRRRKLKYIIKINYQRQSINQLTHPTNQPFLLRLPPVPFVSGRSAPLLRFFPLKAGLSPPPKAPLRFLKFPFLSPRSPRSPPLSLLSPRSFLSPRLLLRSLPPPLLFFRPLSFEISIFICRPSILKSLKIPITNS